MLNIEMEFNYRVEYCYRMVEFIVYGKKRANILFNVMSFYVTMVAFQMTPPMNK
jgi:hypothetical protein